MDCQILQDVRPSTSTSYSQQPISDNDLEALSGNSQKNVENEFA